MSVPLWLQTNFLYVILVSLYFFLGFILFSFVFYLGAKICNGILSIFGNTIFVGIFYFIMLILKFLLYLVVGTVIMFVSLPLGIFIMLSLTR